MPVGLSKDGFQNSPLLKNSFSLSSLQNTASSDITPEKPIKPRQYNSLTKKRVKATAVRRSWGSTASEHGEEFWSVLQANYNYIMDNHLIDKCQEVSIDLTHNGVWTIQEFYSQFSELYSWLNRVQETIYGKEENITDKALRARCVSKVLEKSSSLRQFNDQAANLVQLHPEVHEEVGWRTTHLNSKWDSIVSILGPSDCEMCEQESCLDIDNELKCLRSWFKIMESRLHPLDFRAKYTKTEIETKALELKVLHSEIETHGKIVGSVVKLCKRPDAKCNTANARRIANGLERRWHLLFLRSLEWQCYLESLSKKHNHRSPTSSDESDSDCYQEPASKHPRLSEKLESLQISRTKESESSDDDEAVELNAIVMNAPEEPEGFDFVDGASVTSDSSQFTQSNRKAPNLATYYFKHEDTDSEMDKINLDNISLPKTDCQTSTLDDTSEEEWTYTRKDQDGSTMTGLNYEDEINNLPKKMISEDELRMLVEQAEELVSPEKSRKPERSLRSYTMWLSVDSPDDSCDASAEEDEKESQTSEENLDSTMTLSTSTTSYLELNVDWSGSCNLQSDATTPTNANGYGLNPLSISESAIHRMNLSPKILDRFTTKSTNNCSTNGHKSIEDSSNLVSEKNLPMRRKKSKLKKKALFGRSDTHILHSPGSSRQSRNLLIKSGSFSGYGLQRSGNERHSKSDPSVLTYCEVSTTSGADSDDDARARLPNFKVGLRQRYLNGQPMRDDSSGKNTFNTAESNSLTEAWDNYQENYLSEPYSESHDSDAARRLLNFGEDYRNFIDSQSDWSALSDMSPKFKRKTMAPQPVAEDSNSEEESLRQLINDSREQLKCAQDVFERFKEGLSDQTNEIEDFVYNCDKHIAVLSQITDSSDDFKMTSGDKAVTTGLLNQWRALRLKSGEMQDFRKLQKEISDLKKLGNELGIPETNVDWQIGDDLSEDFPTEIRVYNDKLELIQDQSAKLASLNAVVHRFNLQNRDLDEHHKSALKAEISDLYGLFDNAKTRISVQISALEKVLPVWNTLEARLEQLLRDLSEDGKTLHFLDTVLTNGQFTDQTATCVRDVAKVLAESTNYQGYSLPEFFLEGSFSDSGISDEGSEHEIGERQCRLAAIRRLVRQLEININPDCRARQVMRERLNSAEEELKNLQQRCRNLIVRTAAVSHPAMERLIKKEFVQGKSVKPDGGDHDPNNDHETRRWFRRLFRASIAFQLIILTFVCLSYFYEPKCCENVNNYQWSVLPKLHYDGKPAI